MGIPKLTVKGEIEVSSAQSFAISFPFHEKLFYYIFSPQTWNKQCESQIALHRDNVRHIFIMGDKFLMLAIINFFFFFLLVKVPCNYNVVSVCGGEESDKSGKIIERTNGVCEVTM